MHLNKNCEEFCRNTLLICQQQVKTMKIRQDELIKENNELIKHVKKLNHELDGLTQHFQRLQSIRFHKVEFN